MNPIKNTKREEQINTLTHGCGLAAGLIACSFLLVAAFRGGNGWIIASTAIYSFCLLASYASSTCYHASCHPSHKRFLRKFDHSAIYLFIAGSYTPFTLVTLRNEGVWGWLLFATVWGIAAAGIALSFRKLKKTNHLKTICYLVMGWIIVIAFKPLWHVLQSAGALDILYWLVAGGLFYTFGSLFFFLDKYPYMHPLWHLFVMGGSVCHFWAICLVAVA